MIKCFCESSSALRRPSSSLTAAWEEEEGEGDEVIEDAADNNAEGTCDGDAEGNNESEVKVHGFGQARRWAFPRAHVFACVHVWVRSTNLSVPEV